MPDDNILLLQGNLHLLGFDAGRIDHIAGRRTLAAANALRATLGLAAATRLSDAVIDETLAAIPPQRTLDALAQLGSGDKPLDSHTTSMLQAGLRQLGYDETGRIDGIAGEKTHRGKQRFNDEHPDIHLAFHMATPTPPNHQPAATTAPPPLPDTTPATAPALNDPLVLSALKNYGFHMGSVPAAQAALLFQQQEGLGTNPNHLNPDTIAELRRRALWQQERPPLDADGIRQNIVSTAQQWVGVEEHGTNNGPEVRHFLRSALRPYVDATAAAQGGSYWCAGFASYVFSQAAPEITRSMGGSLPYSTLVQEWRVNYRKAGALIPVDELSGPEQWARVKPGDVLFRGEFAHGNYGGHVGIIESIDLDRGTVTTIDGNAAPRDAVPDASGEIKGYGVLRREYTLQEFFAPNNLHAIGSLDALVAYNNRNRSPEPPRLYAHESGLPPRHPNGTANGMAVS